MVEGIIGYRNREKKAYKKTTVTEMICTKAQLYILSLLGIGDFRKLYRIV